MLRSILQLRTLVPIIAVFTFWSRYQLDNFKRTDMGSVDKIENTINGTGSWSEWPCVLLLLLLGGLVWCGACLPLSLALKKCL